MSLGSRLKQLRVREKQSLQDVADAAGASKAHIWELEKGRSKNPSLDLLARLAAHFDVGVAYLIEEPAEESDRQVVLFGREFKNRLSDKDWDVIRNLAKHLAEKKSDEG